MRVNASKRLAREGAKAAIGTMCNCASPLVAEWIGHSGYDFVVVDMQHGENNLDSVQASLQALSSTNATHKQAAEVVKRLHDEAVALLPAARKRGR